LAINSDLIVRLRGKKAQKSEAASLCAEAADEIEHWRYRYTAVRRASSIALRELQAARLKDEELRTQRELTSDELSV
jgi:hypothetical protein